MDFDAAGHDLPFDGEIIQNIAISTKEFPAVNSYPSEAIHDTGAAPNQSNSTTYPNSPGSPKASPNSNQPAVVQTYIAHVSGPLDGLNSVSSPSTMSFNPSVNDATDQQETPDMSGNSSHASAEDVANSMNGVPGHSPRVTLTTWGSTEARDLSAETEYHNTIDMTASQQEHGYFGTRDTPLSGTYNACVSAARSSNESWDDDGASARSGVDPMRRKSFSDVEVPNFKDQAKKDEFEAKRRDVEEWRSQAGDSTDAVDEGPSRSYAMLNAPSPNRSRSLSTGAVPSNQNSPHGLMGRRNIERPRIHTPGPDDGSSDGEGIRPVSPTQSIRDNRLLEGQVYYNKTAANITDEDVALMQLSRHWNDGPAYPFIISPAIEGKGPTANEMIEKWNCTADTFSLLSRSATWGTRRRSEPSLADIESLRSGSLLKRLSFGKGGEKKPGIFNSLNNTIGNIVRKRSVGESNKLKRHRYDTVDRGRPPASPLGRKEGASTLAPPPRSPSGNRVRPQSPRLQTNFGNELTPGEGHSRRASVSAASPKAAIGGFFKDVNNAIRRSRSKSDLGGEAGLTGLAGQWRNIGGPPVPNLTSPQVGPDEDDLQLHDNSDAEGDEDDDDDLVDDGDLQFDLDTPIVATMDGFRDHVRKLNPSMEPGYLVDRLAHQQMMRYKSLLNWRIRHSGALKDGACNSAEFCLSMGGSTKYYEAKAKGRSSIGKSLHLDGEGSDSNAENQLGAESFPDGVPKPPAQSLPAEFECQLCFKVKKFHKPSDWTKHVHEDVQPFTCTYASCREPKSFKRKADWVRHENERHRHLEWWLCNIDDCNHKCYRKDNFLQHLVREHKLPEPRTKSKAAIKKAKGAEEEVWRRVSECHHETPAKPHEEPCKFCGKTFASWKKLTVHLGKHMEQISLPVLRLVDQRPVDANTIISPVEALPIRQPPATPIGMNRQASSGSSAYHSNSISPNVQQFRQFQRDMMYTTASAMDHFGDNMYIPPMGFNGNPAGNFGYPISQAMGQQPQRGNNMIPGKIPGLFDGMYVSMDSSPHIDHGFGSGIQSFNTHGLGHQTYGSMAGSYASSNDNLSPSPSSYPAASQSFSNFNISTSQPLPMTTEAFLSATQTIPSYQSNQNNILGLDDGSQFGLGVEYQPMGAVGAGMAMGQGPEFGQGQAQMGIQREQSSPYSSSPQRGPQAGFDGLGVGVPMNRNRSSSGGNGGMSGQGRRGQQQQQREYQGSYGYAGQ